MSRSGVIYRVDSRPPNGTWDEGRTYPTEKAARADYDRYVRKLPAWDHRIVRVRHSEQTVAATLTTRTNATTGA